MYAYKKHSHLETQPEEEQSIFFLEDHPIWPWVLLGIVATVSILIYTGVISG